MTFLEYAYDKWCEPKENLIMCYCPIILGLEDKLPDRCDDIPCEDCWNREME
jgi:hypothetical protein